MAASAVGFEFEGKEKFYYKRRVKLLITIFPKHNTLDESFKSFQPFLLNGGLILFLDDVFQLINLALMALMAVASARVTPNPKDMNKGKRVNHQFLILGRCGKNFAELSKSILYRV